MCMTIDQGGQQQLPCKVDAKRRRARRLAEAAAGTDRSDYTIDDKQVRCLAIGEAGVAEEDRLHRDRLPPRPCRGRAGR